MNLRQFTRRTNRDRVTAAQVVAAVAISTLVIVLFHLGGLLCQ